MREGLLIRKCRWVFLLIIRMLFRRDMITRRRIKFARGRRYGNRTGGWWLPEGIDLPGRVVVSAGVGEETSFDEDLLQNRDVYILALDPTPRAIVHGQKLALRNVRFRFIPYGIWAEDGLQTFHAPKDPAHVSHSLVALQGEAPGFQAQCLRWESLLQEQNLSWVDLLKMDIEGAEYRVIADMLRSTILPAVFCLEFDEIQNPMDDQWQKRILRTVSLLEKSGYTLYHIVHTSNYTFVRT
jgi:FkbM family methyltransferase